MKPILLFDIDGTLMHVKKAFTKKLIAKILDDFDIKPNPFENSSFSFAGRTDREIFTRLVAHHGNSRRLYPLVKNRYLEYMEEMFSGAEAEPIEGATELVEFGRKQKLPMGLCTGNFRETAFKKVDAAGFRNRFHFGGFGCNHVDRKHLPGDALLDYKKKHGTEPEPRQFVVIGDTPNDIRCAKYFGAVSVAVTTGSYRKDELADSAPDILVDDLRELIDRLPGL